MSKTSGLLLAAVACSAWALWRQRESDPDPDPGADPPPVRLADRPDPGAARRPLVVAGTRTAGPDVRWIEENERAAELLQEGKLEEAVDAFRLCHRAEPENDVFRRNLAEALVRLARHRHEAGAVAQAIESLALALEKAPDRADADECRALLERWREQHGIEAEHWTEGSDLFELSYSTERSDILHDSQEVLDVLLLAYDDLRLWFGSDPVREGNRARIRVVLLSREEFDQATGLGHWAGGAFDGVVRLPVEDLRSERARWERVLRHELVHAFAHEEGGGAVPGWLNEGLAQWLEGDDAGRADRVSSARDAIRAQDPMPLERLRGSPAQWSDPQEIVRAYAWSLALVDHLARLYGEEELLRMVRGCAEGDPPSVTFERSQGFPLARSLEDLHAELR